MRRARPLFTRLFAGTLLVAIAALAVLGLTLDRIAERRALRDLEDRLVAEAHSVQTTLARTGVDEPFVRALGAASGSRITVIRTDGVVLADSEHDPTTMQNHAGRPEVRAAVAGRIGSAQRTSATLGSPFLYVAVPPRDGAIVRAALPASQVAAQRGAIRWSLAVALIATAALAAAISALVARNLSRPLARISEHVARVASGEFEAIDPEGPREMRALSEAINAMAADLAATVEQIGNETALREQILSAMGEGVILAEGDRVVYANPAARAMLGDEDMQTVPAALAGVAGDGAATEMRWHHPATRELRVVTTPTRGGRTVIVLADVTAAKRLESTRRDFVANASHEMKTPVAAILATAETLTTAVHDDPEAARRFATTLVAEARRLSTLVTDLLDLARLDEPIAEAGVVDLTACIARVADEAEGAARAAGLSLHRDLERDVHVHGRADDLALLARNLLDNAVHYTTAGGEVTVTLRATEGEAMLTVRDTGIGIPSKDLPRVFERFFRVDPARSRATGGTGLGLAIVRHIAETHGGSVTVASELGTGSAFTVRLPLARQKSESSR